MSYRRLTPEEIEDLRAEMRASGQWMKAELAERRRQRAESEAGAGSTESVQSPSPMSNGKASDSAPGDEQV
ncbi:MAG: hypothetical protein CME82_01180 [Halomonas sp.]|mgnify:CR=1 FL=1|nr:hypothetical protein [Halomonas sp.]|tara:strand:+ start:6927 stop:7139 length:213 start_codon:yes stop_codon:yes gene_type:complete